MKSKLISFILALSLLIAIPLSALYKYNPFTRKLDYYEPVSGSDLGDLGDVTLTGLAAGNVLYYNGTAWVNLAAGANGTYLSLAAGIPAWTSIPAPSFLALTDTPAAYTGKAGQLVIVNAGTTALEFFAGSAAGTVIVADGAGGWTKDANFLVTSGSASATGSLTANSGGATGEIGLNLYSINSTFSTMAQSDADGVALKSDLRIGLDETTRRLLVMDRGDIGVDMNFGDTDYANPTLCLFSADTSGALQLSQLSDGSALIEAGGNGDFKLATWATMSMQKFAAGTQASTFSFKGSDDSKAMTHSSGVGVWMNVRPAITQTSTAAYIGFLVDARETSTGSGDKELLVLQVDGADKFTISNTGVISAVEELDITKASTLLVDLNPGFVGSGVVVEITPSAVISTEGAEWDGINIDGSALDPSVGSVALHGIHVDFSDVSVANDPSIDGIRLTLPTGILNERAHSLHANRGFYLESDIGDAAAGVTATTIDVVYDTTGATGGKIHSLDVAAAGTGTVSIAAVGTHTGIDVIHQHIGSITAFDQVWEYDNDGPGWTDITAECSNPAVDVQIWEDVDDEVYFGQDVVFDEIPCVWAIPATNNMFLDFFYSAGGSVWTPFIPSDDTIGGQVTGSFRFLATDLAGWSTDTVNGTANKYWIRIERTRVPFVGPTEDTIKYVAGVSYEWDADGLITIKDLVIVDIFSYDYTTDHNLLLGYLAGEDITGGQGQYNTLLGEQAGTDITTGDNNVVVGYQAGMKSTTNSQSTFVGSSAGYETVGGLRNVAIGYNAFYGGSVDGDTSDNVAVGTEALFLLGEASDYNVAVGNFALRGIGDEARRNTAVGHNAGYDTGGDAEDNVYVGYNAGYGTGASAGGNVAVGSHTLEVITGAQNNVAIGFQAGQSMTSGDYNILIGLNAGHKITTNVSNILIGRDIASVSTSQAHSNVIIGDTAAIELTNGYENVILGKEAARDIKSAGLNVIIGWQASLEHETGNDNVVIGSQAGVGVASSSNYGFNTIVGANAGQYILTAGANNVLIGYQAAQDITSGASNVVIGYMAGEGWLDTESEKLVIDVTDTTTPLIYGDFSADNITINGDFNITMDAALDQIVIAQTDTTGTDQQPLIFIDDDRTGTYANEPSEATLRIDGDGVYSLVIVDGYTELNDNLLARGQSWFYSIMNLEPNLAFYMGGQSGTILKPTINGVADTIFWWGTGLLTAGDETKAIFFNDLEPAGDTAHDNYVAPTLVIGNDEGADLNDYSAVVIGERTQANVKIAHYFDFYAMTGAVDGSVDTADELAAIFRFGPNGTGVPDYATTPGDVLFEGAIEVDGGATHDGLFGFGAVVDLTIDAGGDVTVTKGYHKITVNGGTGSGADDLDTIAGGSEGQIIVIRAATGGVNDTVTVKDDVDNLELNGDFVMDHVHDSMTLLFNGTGWIEVSRSDNE